MKKTFLIAGGVLLAAGAAYAGGLGNTIVEIVPSEPMAEESGSSVPGWVIPVAILALMVGLASSSSDDDDGRDIYD